MYLHIFSFGEMQSFCSFSLHSTCGTLFSSENPHSKSPALGHELILKIRKEAAEEAMWLM